MKPKITSVAKIKKNCCPILRMFLRTIAASCRYLNVGTGWACPEHKSTTLSFVFLSIRLPFSPNNEGALLCTGSMGKIYDVFLTSKEIFSFQPNCIDRVTRNRVIENYVSGSVILHRHCRFYLFKLPERRDRVSLSRTQDYYVVIFLSLHETTSFTEKWRSSTLNRFYVKIIQV